VPKEADKTRKVADKAAPKQTRRTATKKIVAHEHIAERAYYISLESGGDAFENWLRAERELVTA